MSSGRSEAKRIRDWAVGGLMRSAKDIRRHVDPVGWADSQCSVNDWRIALCIAIGVPLEDIHPGTGHNLSGNRPRQLTLFGTSP